VLREIPTYIEPLRGKELANTAIRITGASQSSPPSRNDSGMLVPGYSPGILTE